MPLKFENWDGVTAPSIPAGWTADSPAATTTTLGGGLSPRSSPNVIKLAATGGGGTRRYVTWGTADTNSGDVSVQASFSCNTISDALIFSVFARCDASAAVRTSSTFYAWELDLANLTSKVVKDVAGTVTTLSTVSSISALANGTWYQATFTLVGAALSVTVQRQSDSFWLNSGGTFQSGAAPAHSLTDSAISGAGYAGLALAARSDTAYSDDWTLSTASAPVTASAAITEAHDTAALAGNNTFLATASLAGGNDVLAGMASFTSGSLAKTEGHDTAAIAGWCIVAALGPTERPDTLVGSGAFADAAALGPTGGNDVLAGAGKFKATGSASAAGGADVLAAVGVNTSLATGTLLAGGVDVFAGVGTRSSSAAIGPTEHHDAFAGSSATEADGAIGRTETGDILAGSSFEVRASLGSTEDGDVLAAFQTGLGYNIYSNTGIADPIDYTTPIDTTGLLTWTSGPLTYPGIWRFGVRAFDTLTTLEELNLDCAVTIILDASGIDITNRPKAPTALRALSRASGTIRVEWAYNTINPSPVPTGFHVYIGTGGSPSYGSPAATVSFFAALAGTYVTDLVGLTDGTVYTIGVRAYNGTAEEPNTVTVNCTADATGPAAVVSLTATAV